MQRKLLLVQVLLAHQIEAVPEPVTAGIFIDSCAHRHLIQRAAQRRILYFQRPAYLDLFFVWCTFRRTRQ